METSFGRSHESLCCLPGMTTACALPAEDLHKSGGLGLVAPAAPSSLERVLQPCLPEGSCLGASFYNKLSLGMPHMCSKAQIYHAQLISYFAPSIV